MKKIILPLIIVSVMVSASGKTININKPRGQYVLDMDAIYVLNVNLFIRTYIKFPQGYVVTAAPAGSKDFVGVTYSQNRVYVTNSSPERTWITNLTVHIVTPEGLEREIVFKCVPNRNRKITYGVSFIEPDYSPCNEMVKASQMKYKNELIGTLEDQKKELDSMITHSTLLKTRSVYAGKIGSKGVNYKGAYVYLSGIIEYKSNYYLTLIANVNATDSNAIKFIGVKNNDNVLPVDKLNQSRIGDQNYKYVCCCPSVSDGKKKKIKIMVEVWSKVHEIPVKIF